MKSDHGRGVLGILTRSEQKESVKLLRTSTALLRSSIEEVTGNRQTTSFIFFGTREDRDDDNTPT